MPQGVPTFRQFNPGPGANFRQISPVSMVGDDSTQNLLANVGSALGGIVNTVNRIADEQTRQEAEAAGYAAGARRRILPKTTKEGRPVIDNGDGSFSTEKTQTFQFDGKYYNVPTIYGGKQVSSDEAANIISANGFIDPDTGRKLTPYSSLDEAKKAAEERSKALDSEITAGSTPGFDPNSLPERATIANQAYKSAALKTFTVQQQIQDAVAISKIMQDAEANGATPAEVNAMLTDYIGKTYSNMPPEIGVPLQQAATIKAISQSSSYTQNYLTAQQKHEQDSFEEAYNLAFEQVKGVDPTTPEGEKERNLILAQGISAARQLNIPQEEMLQKVRKLQDEATRVMIMSEFNNSDDMRQFAADFRKDGYKKYGVTLDQRDKYGDHMRRVMNQNKFFSEQESEEAKREKEFEKARFRLALNQKAEKGLVTAEDLDKANEMGLSPDFIVGVEFDNQKGMEEVRDKNARMANVDARQTGKNSMGFDFRDADDIEDVNTHFNEIFMPKFQQELAAMQEQGLTPEQLRIAGNTRLVNYVASSGGIIPDSLMSQIRAPLRFDKLPEEGDPRADQLRSSIDMIDGLIKRVPGIFNDLDKPDFQLARLVGHYRDIGYTDNDAVMAARKQLDPADAGARERRKERLRSDKKVKAGLEFDIASTFKTGGFGMFGSELAGIKFMESKVDIAEGSRVKSQMENAYRRAYEDYWNQYEDAGLAQKEATTLVHELFGESSATGRNTMMRLPPEKYYGIPGKAVNDQLIQFAGKDYEKGDRFILNTDARSESEAKQGKPSYLVTIQKKNGTMIRVLGNGGREARFRPERGSYIQQAKEAQLVKDRKSIQDARDRKRNIEQYKQNKPTPSFLKGKIGYIAPVQGAITSLFGPRAKPTAGASSNHQGIDFAAVRGALAKAAAGGTVIFAGKAGGYGNRVIIDHGNGEQTTYSHLDRIDVKKGSIIAQGKPVGTVGSTGVSTGPHLHFEYKKNGRLRNPKEILGG